MPLIYTLKDPSMTLVSEGSLSKDKIKELRKVLGKIIITRSPDGELILITLRNDINLAYIREMSEREFKELNEKRKKQKELYDQKMKEQEGQNKSSRILQPEYVIPSRRRKG